MATEVEMKAWIDHPDRLVALLDRFCALEAEFVKRDIYLHGPGGKAEDSWAHWNGPQEGAVRVRPQDFRLRIQGDSATCAFKDRALDHGMEVNREIEFTVAEPSSFLQLAARLGCRVFSCKVKRGRRYRYEREGELPLTVELSSIDGLGSFLEVECVLGKEGRPEAPADREVADRTIRDFFASLEIPQEAVEPTPYAKLLADRKLSHCSSIEELHGIDIPIGPD